MCHLLQVPEAGGVQGRKLVVLCGLSVVSIRTDFLASEASRPTGLLGLARLGPFQERSGRSASFFAAGRSSNSSQSFRLSVFAAASDCDH